MTSDLKSFSKNLGKVFKFYSTQQSLLGKSPTFDSIDKNLNTLTKGKLLKFCLDFSIPLKNEEILDLFNQVSGYAKEMNFKQFLMFLEKIRGNRPVEDFYKSLGAQSSKDCLSRCKPFSKKNGSSLPELPPLVPMRRPFNLSMSTKNVASAESAVKSLMESGKSRIISSLPSAAVAIPRFKSRGGSYHTRYGNKKEIHRNWDEINKIDSARVLSIYGDLMLQELVVIDQSDDEILQRFGY
jgi:hypothetical protein